MSDIQKMRESVEEMLARGVTNEDIELQFKVTLHRALAKIKEEKTLATQARVH